MTELRPADQVGPVLEAGSRAEQVLAALRALNPELLVVDHGAYLRVTASRRCVLTRQAVEELSGGRFVLPEDLEALMVSFSGHLSVTDEQAIWSSSPEDRHAR